MRRSRKFCQRGPDFDNFFLFIFFFSWCQRGGRIQIPLKAGHHQHASETPFKWCFVGVPMMAQHWMLSWLLCDFSRGSGPVLLSCDFSGGVWTPVPPLDPRIAYASFSYFQIVGIGLLLIGVWIEVESKDYEALNNDLFIPSIMMMSVGFIIIINSIVGLSGVLKENAALLKLVSILQASR